MPEAFAAAAQSLPHAQADMDKPSLARGLPQQARQLEGLQVDARYHQLPQAHPRAGAGLAPASVSDNLRRTSS